MMKAMIRQMLTAGGVCLLVPVICAADLYFPHVSTRSLWQTEIAMINTCDRTVTGTLNGYSDDGEAIDAIDVTIAPHGRKEVVIADELENSTRIGYVVIRSDATGLQGYTKLYQEGKFRAAVPAVTGINTGDILIPHIASNDTFWTGISLLNTSSGRRNVRILFDDGLTEFATTLNAGQHKTFSSSDMFGGQERPDIKSGVITGASGVIGLELIGSDTQLDGLLLTDDTATTIYYPHVADMTKWWTGIVAYNPSDTDCEITITPYSERGAALMPSILEIGGKEKYVGVVKSLDLPGLTAWFRIDSTGPLAGLELFGALDGKVLAAYADRSGGGSKQGIFPKLEKNGWTGIDLINTEGSPATVILTAYDDDGTVIAVDTISIDGHARLVERVENIFLSGNIDSATYLTFSSNRNVAGFQLNVSSDGEMLDGLPALAGEGAGSGGSIVGGWRVFYLEDAEGYGCSVPCPGSRTCGGFEISCGDERLQFDMFGAVIYTSDGESMNGTYTVSGNIITGCMPGGNCLAAEYSLTDNILIIEITYINGFGYRIYLERVS